MTTNTDTLATELEAIDLRPARGYPSSITHPALRMLVAATAIARELDGYTTADD